MQQIGYVTRDNGDGSASVLFFKNVDLAQKLVDGDAYCDEFYGNDGEVRILTFPDIVDLNSCGFRFSDKDYDSNYGLE